MKPDVVFIDLDCTLTMGNFDELWTHARTRFGNQNSERLASELPEFLEQWAAREETYLEECRKRRISHLEFGRRQMIDLLHQNGVEMKPDEAEAAWLSVLDDYLHGVPVYPDVSDCLDRLSGYRLVVLTNGMPEWQKKKAEASGFRDRFEAVLTPGETGGFKPDQQVFLNACEYVGCEPGACINVGDNPEIDVIAAIDAGLGAVWLNRDSVPSPQSGLDEITSLSELPGLVESLC